MSKSPGTGILQQMADEQEAAREVGLAWTVREYIPDSEMLATDERSPGDKTTAPILVSEKGVRDSWVAFRRAFYRWLLRQESCYDVILLRHSSYDPFQYLYLCRARLPVFLVHHTLEVPELSLQTSGFHRLKAPSEALFGHLSVKRATGQIGVTREIVDYEARRAGMDPDDGFVYPNGYRCSDSFIAEDRREQAPHLLFVASHFYPWHGLDIFLNAVLASNETFHVDIVGGVPYDLRAQAEDDSRIQFHGVITQKGIRQLAGHADLGLSSFALSRKNMNDACTLKVREYLAMGLPACTGHRDVFPASFAYYRNCGCDMDEILAYAREMRAVPRHTVAAAAKPYIDKQEQINALYRWLEERCCANAPASTHRGQFARRKRAE